MMNKVLDAMIQSLLADAQTQCNHAASSTAGNHVWTAHMVASIMLQSTAKALIEAKEAAR